MNQILSELKTTIKGTMRLNEPMSLHVTYRVGGPAELMIFPEAQDDIVTVLKIARIYNVPVNIFGGGSNIIPDDEAIRGIVIKVGDGLASIKKRGETIIAEAGAKNSDVALLTARDGISGFVFMHNIPGRIGGLCYMNGSNNAGCFEDIALSVEWLDWKTLEVKQFDRESLELQYRSSIFHRIKGIILNVTFKAAQKEDPNKLFNQMEKLKLVRQKKFPMEYPNAGSVFKRPPGDYAGRLIQVSGCGRLRYGGAMVSTKHHGFIVNIGNATATDIRTLTKMVQEQVLDKTGVSLEREQLDFPIFR